MNKNLILNSSLTEQIFCPAIFDYLCWPQTPANQSATISCSSLVMQGVDATKFVSRHCLPTGKWAPVLFKSCVYPDVWELMTTFYTSKSAEGRKAYTNILQATRIIELVGLSVSFISVLLSLLIFFTFRSLYCSRTKIHINLLLAIFIQIIARIANYGIQMTQSNNPPSTSITTCGPNGTIETIEKSSILQDMCPLIVIFLQFSITSMFMWMLCEGIHLNNVLTVSVFKNHFKTWYFYILGWILPFCITLSWSVVMFVKERSRKCWANYNYLKYYWIIDGPRYGVMILNVIFLLNIIRVLLIKIKEGSEKQIRDDRHRRGSMNTKFVKKAVKAAVFLLPLLGITHMLETFVSPDHRSIPLFALYCSITYFLITFQGFFCSLLYCFLNTEVRETLKRRLQTTQFWTRWKRCLGKKDQYRNSKINSDDRTKLELLMPQPSSKKTSFEMDNHRLYTNDSQSNIEHPRTSSC